MKHFHFANASLSQGWSITDIFCSKLPFSLWLVNTKKSKLNFKSHNSRFLNMPLPSLPLSILILHSYSQSSHSQNLVLFDIFWKTQLHARAHRRTRISGDLGWLCMFVLSLFLKHIGNRSPSWLIISLEMDKATFSFFVISGLHCPGLKISVNDWKGIIEGNKDSPRLPNFAKWSKCSSTCL